ncbi:MAG: MFS transporter [Pseudomonadota bacterium]
MTESTPTNAGPLFFQRRFWPMWTALSLGTFADNVLRQALLIGISFGIIIVPGFANADDSIPVIGALLPAGILLFSSVSGQLADKYETSMMFRRTKATEIVLMVAAAAAFITGNGLFAVAMLFAMGAQSAFFSPVRVGAMPKYLKPDELVRGNGLCNAGLFTFILLGYGVGGYLIAQPGGPARVGVVLVIAAVLGWLASLRAPEAAANNPDLPLSFNAPAQTWRMFQLVADAPGVAPALLGVGVFYLLSTAVTVLVPLFARDTLGADANVATALNGLFAVGAGLGAMIAASMAKGRSGLKASTGAVFAAGALSIALGVVVSDGNTPGDGSFGVQDLFSTPKGIFVTLGFVATSALMGVYIAPLQAAMQRRAPAPVRARIMAASAFTNALFAIPGSLSILFITRTGLSPQIAFIGVGITMGAIGAIMAYRGGRYPQGLYDETLQAANQTDK